MISTRLMLDAKDYTGPLDLILCNGAHIQLSYGNEEILACSDVWLLEYMPPRYSRFHRQIKSPKLDDMPF